MLDSKSGVEQKTYFLMNKIVTNIIQTILLLSITNRKQIW